ncbi:MAG TPA: hypothetical protein VG841_12375 [Caulobacterales bacterium]|nr:hypothetical protein [Caulobacterales bacterium]
MSVTSARATQAVVERNYIIGSALCGGAYLALTLGAKLAIGAIDPRGAALIALAVAPVAPIIAFVLVFARYLSRLDEYRRHRVTQALLIAVGVFLAVSSTSDFLQGLGKMPPLQPFVLTSGFILVYGLAHCALNLADKIDRRAEGIDVR